MDPDWCLVKSRSELYALVKAQVAVVAVVVVAVVVVAAAVAAVPVAAPASAAVALYALYVFLPCMLFRTVSIWNRKFST